MQYNYITQDIIREWRRELLLGDKPFIRIPNFVSEQFIEMIQQRWRTMSAQGFAPFISNANIQRTSPNYHLYVDNQFHGYYLFPWNAPVDEYTHHICLAVHQLRNKIEGHTDFHHIFPYENRFVQFRVLRSLNGGMHVAQHADFIASPPPKALSKHVFDPNRIQATLLLSQKHIDYTGEGFVFIVGEHVIDPCADAKSGDLLLWRYTEQHAVREVYSHPSQLGFLRIIFPVVDR